MSGLDGLVGWVRGVRGGRLVVACVGSELRCDDVVGLSVCRVLERYCGGRVVVVECPGGLELCVHRVVGEEPTHLLVVDGVLAGLEPGEVIFTCDVEGLDEFAPVTTHYMPLSVSVRYIRATAPSVRSVCLLGIQVGCLDLGGEPSSRVLGAADRVARMLCGLLRSE